MNTDKSFRYRGRPVTFRPGDRVLAENFERRSYKSRAGIVNGATKAYATIFTRSDGFEYLIVKNGEVVGRVVAYTTDGHATWPETVRIERPDGTVARVNRDGFGESQKVRTMSNLRSRVKDAVEAFELAAA